MKRVTCIAWAVHAFTASGAVVGLFALKSIDRGDLHKAFWLMALAVLIDGVDGYFARKLEVRTHAPQIDGARLDEIVDYLNYVIVPAYLILRSNLVNEVLAPLIAGLLVICSAYQFSQRNAKTEDHFFQGFPSYWNIVVLYMFLWNTSSLLNLLLLLLFAVLVFIPIKYVYPSRMEHLSSVPFLRALMLAATLAWGAATLVLLWIYPEKSQVFNAIVSVYMITYISISLGLTWTQRQNLTP